MTLFTTRATIEEEVNHFFSEVLLNFGSLRPLPKTGFGEINCYLPVEESHGLRYTTRTIHAKKTIRIISDDFGIYY